MNKAGEIKIIPLHEDHSKHIFLEVASLHIRQISHGALSRLGPGLLSRIYFEIARQPGSGLWVAMDQEKVAGFISGSRDTRLTFRKVILASSVNLTLFAIGMLLKFRFLPFFRIMLYPLQKSHSSKHAFAFCHQIRAELLSVVVSDDYQHRGLGKSLIETFEKQLIDWNGSKFYKVASDVSVPGNQHFYLRSEFQPCHTITLNETVLQIFVKDIPERTPN